ncbi:heat shock factor protein HSF24-like [Prosopis cineraria]|uniref:heat shock factor protein HSF24-like n=1 Tax=Prosopis cineraria TaxID=364024 RepID=UPI0024104D36|nr:heat shock factor protein HSF24-like [Prosopis cineraria]
MTQRSAPAPFLTKTYQLVDDERTNDVISWSESGDTFVVWKQADFAKDLLPNYFKHNNFSSFVRQLNTYGFRKIVPDKWEFANENFKRGRKELLSEIKRRKTLTQPSGKSGSGGGGNSASNSGAGDDAGSTSTSSSHSKSKAASAETKTGPEYAELSGENEKLRKDNEMLSWELAEAKKQCEELVSFLTEYLKVGPDQINRIIMREGTGGSSCEEEEEGKKVVGEEEEGESLKLFGVWLRGEKERTEEEKMRAAATNLHHKRGREDQMAFGGPHPSKELKTMHLGASPVNVMIN